MKKKKIYILLGHPDSETLSGYLADSYGKAAREGGHTVRRTNIGELKFDPILHYGYKKIQELEPDLKKVQTDIKWADHVVIVYPNWWCSMPAPLKGMFDRMFLPGFAFNFSKEKDAEWEKLLTGKSARVIITSGMSPIKAKFHFGDFTNELSRGILEFSGFHPVDVTTFGPSERASEEKKKLWHQKVEGFGKKGV